MGSEMCIRDRLQRGLEGADFDDQSGVEIVDRTRSAGDAVTAAGGRTGELVYWDCDFGAGATEVTALVSGTGSVELALEGGPVLAVLETAESGSGPYDYTTLGAAIAVEGVHDVRLRLRGALRLARVDFSG